MAGIPLQTATESLIGGLISSQSPDIRVKIFKSLLADERVRSTELSQMEVYNGTNTLPILPTVLEGLVGRPYYIREAAIALTEAASSSITFMRRLRLEVIGNASLSAW